jgi:DNA mismatch endonuclease, patch repair protein
MDTPIRIAPFPSARRHCCRVSPVDTNSSLLEKKSSIRSCPARSGTPCRCDWGKLSQGRSRGILRRWWFVRRKDRLTREQRSVLMSRVRTKDTDLERLVRSELHRRGFRFRKHLKHLPGCPDLVLTRHKIAVFIDGDFWHGYRLPEWEQRLQPFWRAKLRRNRERDLSNFRKLRRRGWRVVRLWQHELKKDLNASIRRITSLLEPGR